MSNEFVREARYVVLKSADVTKCLTVSELIELRRIQAKVEEHRAEIGKPPLDCVVVEADWPEYEPTWKAIEARVTGAQPSSSAGNRWTHDKPTTVGFFWCFQHGKVRMVNLWSYKSGSEIFTNEDYGASINDEMYDGAQWMKAQKPTAPKDNGAQPAPSVPDGWQLVPTAESRHPGVYKMLGALHAADNTPGASEWESYAAFLAAAPEAKP